MNIGRSKIMIACGSGVAALVLATAGCSNTQDASSPGDRDTSVEQETSQQSYSEWAEANTETYSNALVRAADATTRVSSSVGSNNTAMAAALLDLADAGDQLASILPSPDSEVNRTVRAFADTMQSARGLAASAANPSESDLDAILGLGDEISSNLAAVQSALGSAN